MCRIRRHKYFPPFKILNVIRSTWKSPYSLQLETLWIWSSFCYGVRSLSRFNISVISYECPKCSCKYPRLFFRWLVVSFMPETLRVFFGFANIFVRTEGNVSFKRNRRRINKTILNMSLAGSIITFCKSSLNLIVTHQWGRSASFWYSIFAWLTIALCSF